jgi:hypothetical protein
MALRINITALLLGTALVLHGCALHSSRGFQASEAGDWVFIHGHPSGKPPYFLSPDILARLYPQIANPRVPSAKDIGDETDQWHFIAGGFSFVLFGDFNQDGLYDVALVGKYDDLDIGMPQFFFSIFTIKGTFAKVQEFTKLRHQRAALKAFPDFVKSKYGAILLVYTFESCHCGYVYWNGSKYEDASCSEVDESTKDE